MADETRISKLDNVIQKFFKTSNHQQQLTTEIVHRISTMDSRYEQLFQELKQEKGKKPSYPSENNNSVGGSQFRIISNWIFPGLTGLI